MAVAAGLAVPEQLLVPASARVKALFGEHATKTGNPLVDSVAEHQPATQAAYWRYLQHSMYTATAGMLLLLLEFLGGAANRAAGTGPLPRNNAAALFLLLNAASCYFFSLKMNRLILFLGAPAAALSGVLAGRLFDWGVAPLYRAVAGARRPCLDSLRRPRVLPLFGLFGLFAPGWPTEARTHLPHSPGQETPRGRADSCGEQPGGAGAAAGGCGGLHGAGSHCGRPLRCAACAAAGASIGTGGRVLAD